MDAEMKEPKVALLPDKRYAIVQCDGFRCLAYKTPDGRWKMASTNDDLNDAVPVSDLF